MYKEVISGVIILIEVNKNLVEVRRILQINVQLVN